MSGSDYTLTTNLALFKPTVDADEDMWGTHTNSNWDVLDTLLKSGAGGTFLPLSGGTMSGALVLAGLPANPNDAASKDYVDSHSGPPAGTIPPTMDSVANAGTATAYSREDHTHPTDTTRYAASNPAGYITSASLPLPSSTLPLLEGTAAIGTSLAYARADHVHPSGGGGASITVSDTPPTLTNGAMWFDGISTQLYIGYDDGNSSQWVIAVNGGGAGTAGVSSFNTRTGAVTLSSGDVTGALTFTPYNATNPAGYQTAAQVTTALAPYAPLAAPVFTGDARAPTPTYGDNDTSIATTAFVQSAVAPAGNNAGRNLLHNATMAVAQRGNGPWATGGYTVDRWTAAFGNDTLSVSRVTLADADRAAIGDESAQYSLQGVFTGSATGGSFSTIVQRIENVRRLGGRTITISLWAKSASGTPSMMVQIGQNFGTGGSPSASTFTNSSVATISTAWSRYSWTLSLPSISGKTFGSNGDDNTALAIFYSVQGTYVQSGTINIWGVQLEIGSVATPLDYGGSPQQQLAECQRFYQTGSLLLSFYQTAGQPTQLITPLPVVMRAAPTVTVNVNGNTNVSGFTLAASGSSGVYCNGSATGTGAGVINSSFFASADL